MRIEVFHIYRPGKISAAELKPAGFRERVFAQLIDGIILGAFIGILLAVISQGKIFAVWISPMIPVFLVQHVEGFIPNLSDWWWGGYHHTISLKYLADINLAFPSPLQWILYIFYYTFFHSTYGQTPGKMMKGLVVLSEQKRILSAGRSFLRWLCYLLSIIPLGFGFWMMLISKRRICLHDLLARTRVYRFVELAPNTN
ncbi:MAG: RDD family protein [Calditrichota bacterium]